MIRTMAKKGCIFILLMLCLACSVIPSDAAEKRGKITIEKIANGMQVHICKIAYLDDTGYYLEETFKESGITLSNVISSSSNVVAVEAEKYVRENGIETINKSTSNEKVYFEDLELGIWLVFCDVDGEYIFNPFFVFLPSKSNGQLDYEVVSSPKLEEANPDRCNISVVKIWDDKNDVAKKRPQSITIELLSDGNIISSAILSGENGWKYTFLNVEKDRNYSVKEKEVDYYHVKYEGDVQSGFVITNTYVGKKLPQTGQIWWPVVLLAIAGVGFSILGIIELGERKNETK